MTSTKTIRFPCPHCGKRLRVAAEAARKRVRCPGCASLIGALPRPDRDEESFEPEPSRPLWPWLAGGGAAFALVLGLGIVLISGRKDPAAPLDPGPSAAAPKPAPAPAAFVPTKAPVALPGPDPKFPKDAGKPSATEAGKGGPKGPGVPVAPPAAKKLPAPSKAPEGPKEGPAPPVPAAVKPKGPDIAKGPEKLPAQPPPQPPATGKTPSVKAVRASRALLGDGKQLTANFPDRDIVLVLEIKGVAEGLRRDLFFSSHVLVGGMRRTFNSMTIPSDSTRPIWAATVIPRSARTVELILGGLPPQSVEVSGPIAAQAKAY